MQPADGDFIRRINRHRVLSELRRRGESARVEIAEATQLSRATVTALTAELIEEGLVIASEPPAREGTGRPGRPRVRLRLNPQAAHVAGVKISMHQIAVSVTNFVGDVLFAAIKPVRVSGQSTAVVADLVDELLRRALAELGLPLAAVSGVGIGVPGFIDPETGVCHWSPLFGDAGAPFGALMHQRLGRPVYVDNDVNLVTLAEQWFGSARGLGDFLVVTVEHGVGMGAVIGGALYRGHRGLACEFGHMKIQRGGAFCRCGQRGCIEAYVADYAIVREASALLSAANPGDPLERQTALARLVALARAGDARAQAIYARAGEVLGIGVANLINVFNPPLVIVSGGGVAAFDVLEPAFREAVKANTLGVAEASTRILVNELSDEAWARGAAALVLQNLFRVPLTRPVAGAPA